MNAETIIKYPLVFFAALLTALALTPLWIRWAMRWNFLDRPGGRKQHLGPRPTGGGVVVFLAFHAACVILFLPSWAPFAGQVSVDGWHRFLLLSAGVLVLGLVDDRFSLSPLLKLAGQILLAVAAYMLDIHLQNILGITLPGWFDFIATIFWFLLVVNAFNLIDGIDGLAAGIAVIASLAIGLSMVFRQSPGDVLLFLGLAGACLGFLRYNFYPARVFLGDAGSMFIGFTIAALAISTNSKGPAMAAIGMPMLAIGVPLFDTLLAIWRRSVRFFMKDPDGRGWTPSFESADADHLHHRLLRSGKNHSQVAVFCYIMTALLAGAGLAATVFHNHSQGILGLTFLLAAYTVMRHLAWIELQESGWMVLRGLSRPVRRNRTLLLYLMGDVLLLNAALLASLLLQYGPEAGGIQALKKLWLENAPLDLGLPFLFLLLFRSYSRVWYLARISEYVSTVVAVLLGVAFACALQILGTGSSEQMVTRLLHAVLYAGLAAPAVLFVRAAVRMIQDLVFWRQRAEGGTESPELRALVCGAGYNTTLFLRRLMQRSSTESFVRVVGLVDRDEAIRGHFVHGLPVLGRIEELPALIAEYHVNTVYLVEESPEEEIQQIQDAVEAAGVNLLRWEIREVSLVHNGEAASQEVEVRPGSV